MCVCVREKPRMHIQDFALNYCGKYCRSFHIKHVNAVSNVHQILQWQIQIKIKVQPINCKDTASHGLSLQQKKLIYILKFALFKNVLCCIC